MPASLRSDGVRDHPGMPFGFIPDLAYGFAGIPSFYEVRTKGVAFLSKKWIAGGRESDHRSGRVTGKPEVMPPGWQIAPDKRPWSDAFPAYLIIEFWRYADLSELTVKPK